MLHNTGFSKMYLLVNEKKIIKIFIIVLFYQSYSETDRIAFLL